MVDQINKSLKLIYVKGGNTSNNTLNKNIKLDTKTNI